MEEIKDKKGNIIQISIAWCADDVRHCAKENGVKLSAEEVSDVLSLCLHKHDANEGINWVVIACHIDRVVSERGKGKIKTNNLTSNPS